MKNIILIGPPGCGKGSQSENIKKMGYFHISTGDIIRENIKNNTEQGKLCIEYSEAGRLVPDKIINKMVAEKLKVIEDNLIWDGYPRTLEQAEALETMLRNINAKVDVVILFEISKDLLMERVLGRRVCPNCQRTYHIINMKPIKEGYCDKCNVPLIIRKDDTRKKLLIRINEFEIQTKELINYYWEKGLIKVLNSNQPYVEVKKDIEKIVNDIN